MDPWASVPGQPAAVEQLRASVDAPVHAYLFVGPPGSGRRAAAAAFAGELLSDGSTDEQRDRNRRLAAAEQHPDLVIIEPDATTFRYPKADADPDSPGLRFVREVASSPREGDRKVVVAVDFHLARDEAVGKLLKTIEEPPPTAIVVLLADEIPPDQVTIASRCARVEFGPVPTEVIAEVLSETTDTATARVCAEAAQGDLRRARVLAGDPDVRARRDAWATVPSRLDGSGGTVFQLVAELTAMIDAAQGPLDDRHGEELAEFDAQQEARGTRGRRKELVDRHKREVRRYRTKELRFGWATLGSTYRDALSGASEPDRVLASLDALVEAGATLEEHNPIERLLLQALFLRLVPLAA